MLLNIYDFRDLKFWGGFFCVEENMKETCLTRKHAKYNYIGAFHIISFSVQCFKLIYELKNLIFSILCVCVFLFIRVT